MEVGTGPEGKEIPVKAAGVTGIRAGRGSEDGNSQLEFKVEHGAEKTRILFADLFKERV